MGYNTTACSGSANASNSPLPCSIRQVAMNQMGDQIRALSVLKVQRKQTCSRNMLSWGPPMAGITWAT